MRPDEQEELTAAAIARLAGVGRAAVSNWRRRYDHFPRPIGGSEASPTFSASQVKEWLETTGKGDQLATAGRTDTGTQRLDDPTAPARTITDLTPRELLARVMASLLPRSTVVPSPIDPEDLPAVLDPACSDATWLLAVADRFGDAVRLVGQDRQEPVTEIATQRLRAGVSGAPYEVHTGDSLLHDRLARYRGSAAAVVCAPPLGRRWPAADLATDPRWEFGVPGPRDGELAWVEHCIAQLRPRGVAVVAVSPRTCVEPSGRGIRAALVRTSALRDVISLPGGPCLWVLERPSRNLDAEAVRMADLSTWGDMSLVPHEPAAWERLLSGADPTISRAVPRLALLDDDTDLLPAHHVTPRVEASADDLVRVTERLQALYAEAGRCFPALVAPTSTVHHTAVTFGELERVGALTIHPRDITPRRGDLLLRTLGRPPVVATGTDADDGGVAQVVEIDEQRLDAHFVATFLRADAAALPVANTHGALSRDDLRRCRIPRVPLVEQRRYGDAFRRLSELQAMLAGLARVSTTVIDQTIHALTTGAVIMTRPPKVRRER